jgi:5-aminolevulinate synthase
MFSYHAYCKDFLNKIKKEGRYPSFMELERLSHSPPYAISWALEGEKEVVVWCTNDYLSMSHHPNVIEAFQRTASFCGVGSGGTRNISGNSRHHVALEKTMASLHKQEKALIFSSGYSANESVLYTLGKHFPDFVFFSDECNHASIIMGIKNSQAQKKIFSHNDVGHLKGLLEAVPRDIPKAIVCESIYSMSGDLAPLKEISQLAQKHNALLIVDEVHAVGLYGEEGEGIMGALDIKADIILGNFAKAYGCIGGYMAGPSVIVDMVRSTSPRFVFTTSIPPAAAAASLASVQYLQNDRAKSKLLFENTTYFKRQLANSLVRYVDNQTHIVPIMICDAFLCQELAKVLLEQYSIYVQPINYPTVPRGQERFRITLTPDHTKKHIDDFVEAISCLWSLYVSSKAA